MTGKCRKIANNYRSHAPKSNDPTAAKKQRGNTKSAQGKVALRPSDRKKREERRAHEMERPDGARPGGTGGTAGKGKSTEEQDAAERRDTRHIATGRTKSGKSTCRRDVNTPEHEFSRDHTNYLMECRVIHRGASRHHHNRMREADLSGLRETINNFYQLQEEAPAGETAARGTTYTHSTLEPPSRNDEKKVWTR